MEKPTARWTLGALAEQVGGTLEGPADLPLAGVGSADGGDPHAIAFAENDGYVRQARASGVGALLVPPGLDAQGVPCIRVEQPRLMFFLLLKQCEREVALPRGIHPSAVVDPTAAVDPDASVGPLAVVAAGARVAARAQVFSFCYVGEGCSVGEGSVMLPGAVLVQDVSVGRNCLLHSGVVLGADGFGFVWDGSSRVKVPQVGRVELGDDVEIGANTTIDRATAGATRIGTGAKLDNLVQIGHNSEVGEHSVIAGQTGISGSTKIGKRVVMGGGVGTKDHVTIADDVVLGGRSGVDRDITEAGEYFGTPARPAREAVRSFLLATKLPEFAAKLRDLEKRIAELEGKA